VLKNNLVFHDGKPLSADDVIFTIEKTLDSVIKSPKRTVWEGVQVGKISEREIRFTLRKPYSQFKESLTLGILPKHIWGSVSSEEFPFSQFNIDPIGSGPYKVSKISRNSGGIPTSITLEAWRGYALGRPKIKTITFKFFQNDLELAKALNSKSVENSVAMSRKFFDSAKAPAFVATPVSLPRVFGVFFNQNLAPVFLNPEVREALDLAAPRQKIVDEVLGGFGKGIRGPTPKDAFEWSDFETDLEKARDILLKAGWKPNELGVLEKKTKKDTTVLAFSVATSDTGELKRTAEILKESWNKLGASVEVKVFESGDLNQNVIRPRKYDALLFGEIVSKESDLYPFWHSSQRNDPGLNISLYANITADKLLEDMQKGLSQEDLSEKLALFKAEISKDRPAVFLFTPDFSYIFSPSIKNITLKDISSQNERFLSVKDWYIETDRVWKIFAKNY
jgi:peptide/nickel transport system substrate-binding protein